MLCCGETTDNSSAAFGRDCLPDQRSIERERCALPINLKRTRLAEALARAFRRGDGALEIDFLGALGKFRENNHALGQNFREPVNHCQMPRLGAFAVGQFADAQLREQRRVARQNAEISFLARQLDGFHSLAQHLPRRRHNLEINMFRQH